MSSRWWGEDVTRRKRRFCAHWKNWIVWWKRNESFSFTRIFYYFPLELVTWACHSKRAWNGDGGGGINATLTQINFVCVAQHLSLHHHLPPHSTRMHHAQVRFSHSGDGCVYVCQKRFFVFPAESKRNHVALRLLDTAHTWSVRQIFAKRIYTYPKWRTIERVVHVMKTKTAH